MIDLYFWPTPNGYKAAIMLAELDLPYNVIPVNITAGEQFRPEFLEINPNNKVPAIVDHDGPHNRPIGIFESAAILLYFAEKTGRFLSEDAEKRYEAIQWLIFQNTTMGPMLGQAHHFMVYASEKVDYAIERYDREVGRIYNILEKRLSAKEYLAGDYSIADISTFPWVRTRKLHRRDLADYPNIDRWYQAIKNRPGVHAGLNTLAEKKVWEANPGTDEWNNMFGKTR